MATRTWEGADATTPNSWSVAGNWAEGSVPVSSDDVYIPAGSANITAGLNQSAVTLDSLNIESGFTGNIGDGDTNLQIGVATGSSVFIAATAGTQYIDFGASTPDIEVYSTGGAASGSSALNIIGSAIDVLSINSGSVGIAGQPGDTATVTTVRLLGGNLRIGDGATLTTVELSGGTLESRSGATTVNLYGGRARVDSGAVTTVNLYDGTYISRSPDTITNLNLYGGRADFSSSGVPRTVTTATVYAYGSVDLLYDPSVVTVSTLTQPTRPVSTSWSP